MGHFPADSEETLLTHLNKGELYSHSQVQGS